jgi:predicted ArsR family transcriptional regulator
MVAACAAGLSDLDALAALGDRTRRQLYELVVESVRPVGRYEAAEAAQIDRSLAAYHLDKLVECGLLEASYGRPPGRAGPGAGRPTKLSRRTRREFVLRVPARDYRLLAELLVRAADESNPELKAAIAQAARELGHSLGDTARRSEADNQDALQALLRSRGYEPVETEPGLVRLRNCPFDAVAGRYPAIVCGLNLALIEGMLAGLGADPTSAVLAPQDGVCCVAIQRGESAPSAGGSR